MKGEDNKIKGVAEEYSTELVDLFEMATYPDKNERCEIDKLVDHPFLVTKIEDQ